MKKLNWKIILIVIVVIIIIVIIINVYKNKQNSINITSEANRLEVKCVVECKDDEVCIKGACVKKKINYIN